MAKKIKDLNPAEYNPRKISDKQMELLDKTLHEFGDLSGIVYNVATNTLVGGHQRIKNFNSNSVIDKTPFTDEVGTVAIGYINTEIGKFSYREVNWSLEKEKAANIAANKSGGEWDFTKLKDLMENLDTGELDLELTGFDNQEIEKLLVDIKDPVDLLEPGQFRDEIEYFNLSKFYPSTSNDYGIPDIQKQDIDIYGLMGFNFCLSSSKKEDKENTIHYFLDDYQFERVWNSPSVYLKILQKFNGCLSPDFSLYTDFPIALQIYNTYRNRWLAAYWQENNINVIPTVSWSNKESYEFCFLGIPETSPVAVSTVGIMKDKTYQKNFMNGFNKMLEVIKPEKVIIYGESFPELDKIETPLIYFKAFQTKHREV